MPIRKMVILFLVCFSLSCSGQMSDSSFKVKTEGYKSQKIAANAHAAIAATTFLGYVKSNKQDTTLRKATIYSTFVSGILHLTAYLTIRNVKKKRHIAS